jgi:hypothetical protein
MDKTCTGVCDLYCFSISNCKGYSTLLNKNNMKKNVGNIDKVIRVLAAVVFGVLYFTGTVTGTLGLVLLVLGVVFLATSAMGFCPIYSIVGMNTCPVKKA